jgi:ferric-dicitrate binding protein FerR (iron transport regulator)
VSRCIREREIFALLDGSIKPRAKQRVERHLETCAECANRVQTLSRLKAAAVDALPPLEPNWARINPAIEHAIAEATRRPERRLAWAPLGLSAAAAVLVAIALIVTNPPADPDLAPIEQPEVSSIARAELVYEPLELLEIRISESSSASQGPLIGEPIRAGDTLTTSSAVAVRVAFGPRASLDVYPNSRLTLHSGTVVSPSIELVAGTSLIDIPAGALEHELTVLAGDSVFTILDGTVELTVTDDGSIIAVLDGAVAVADDADRPTVLAAGVWRSPDRSGGAGKAWLRLARNELGTADGVVAGEDLTEREWERPTGTLPKRVVRETFARAKPNLKVCYETALKRFPELEVSVTARVSVGTRGQVSKVRLRGGERWPDLERCISSVLNQLSFPPPNGGPVDLIFPLRLSPER